MAHLSEKGRHLLILVGVVEPSGMARISEALTSDSGHEVFSYTPNAWIVCTRRHSGYYEKLLSNLMEPTGGPAAFMVMDVSSVKVSSGSLPAAAWGWLGRHQMGPR